MRCYPRRSDVVASLLNPPVAVQYRNSSRTHTAEKEPRAATDSKNRGASALLSGKQLLKQQHNLHTHRQTHYSIAHSECSNARRVVGGGVWGRLRRELQRPIASKQMKCNLFSQHYALLFLIGIDDTFDLELNAGGGGSGGRGVAGLNQKNIHTVHETHTQDDAPRF